MKTQYLSKNDLLIAAALIRKGELVVFPTETVYGLGASIWDNETIKKIFEVKGRPQDNPLIAHVAHYCDAEEIARDLPEAYFLLAKAFFPGPLTLVVRKNKKVPTVATAGLDTIAIRSPNHFIALELIKEVGSPLVAPSANLSGRPSSTDVEHVFADFDGKIAAVIDGGACEFGIESTVVDLCNFDTPTLLRPGALSCEDIEAVLKKPLNIYQKGPKSSPGMKYRHYAPNIPVYVCTDDEKLKACVEREKNSFVLTHPQLSQKTLYANLRLAEKQGYDDIIIDCRFCDDPPLLNRLEKINDESHLH